MKIMIVTNKYEKSYYRFSTPEEQHAAALKVFNINQELQYYFDLEEVCIEDDKNEIQNMVEEIAELEKIPTLKGRFKAELEKLKKELPSKEERLKESQAQIDLWEKAQNGDGAAALKLLRLRRGYEYEGWETGELK